MQIAKQLAGFEPSEAETLRRAIGKKIHSLMASLKDKFLQGCAENGVTPAVANQLWKDMEQSQDYSFNKAHAACYALIAYRTAWLKANHPCEYMAALISSVMNTKDRVPLYVNACHEMGIEVLPPDVNTSQTDFAVVEGKIRFGLNAVKNVGEACARAIVAERDENGPFDVGLGLRLPGRPAADEQARARGARQVRRPRLDSATRAWGCSRSRCSSRSRSLRPARAGRPHRRAGLDLRRDAVGVGASEVEPGERARPSDDLDDGVRQVRAAAAREGDRSASTSPSIRSTACATSCGARPTARSASSSGAATARS